MASRSGKIQAGADAAAFFSTDQDILLQHEFADVLEADGNFVELAAVFGGELIDQLGDRKGLGNVAGKFSSANEVPNHKRENLVRVDEAAVAIDGADAVAIAIRSEARVIFPGQNRFAQRFDVRLDGLGMHASEKWIARTANFIAFHAISSKQFGE